MITGLALLFLVLGGFFSDTLVGIFVSCFRHNFITNSGFDTGFPAPGSTLGDVFLPHHSLVGSVVRNGVPLIATASDGASLPFPSGSTSAFVVSTFPPI